MRLTDFLSITCKLVHAAQYRPAGRPYLDLHVYCHATVREEERNESSDRSRSAARLGLVAEGARRPE